MARRKKQKWTQKQLDILYECWKEAEKPKDRIPLVEEKLPEMPPATALGIIRKLARTDPKWIRWSTRKKNEAEKAKLEKKKERERKKAERDKRRQLREKKKELREKEQQEKSLREKLQKSFKEKHSSQLAEKVPPEFFFCPDTQQYVNNNSCIFRVFSEGPNGFSYGPPCDKCKRMDKYIPVIQEIIKNDRRNKKSTPRKAAGGNTTSEGRSQNKKKKASSKKETSKAASSRKRKKSRGAS